MAEFELGEEIKEIINQAYEICKTIQELEKDVLQKNVELGFLFQRLKIEVRNKKGPKWLKFISQHLKGISRRQVQQCMRLSQKVPLKYYPILVILGQEKNLTLMTFTTGKQNVVELLEEKGISVRSGDEYHEEEENFRMSVENLLERLEKPSQRKKNILETLVNSSGNFMALLEKLLDAEPKPTKEVIDKLEDDLHKIAELLEELKKR